MRDIFKKALKRLRGVLGTGLTWAVAWAGLFTGVTALFGVEFGILVTVAVSKALAGFVAGTGFAVVLGISERRHTFDELSLKRVAAWGALGGLAAHAVVGMLAFGSPFFWLDLGLTAFIASSSAVGSVALARRADAKLIEGAEDGLLSLEEG